MKTYTVSLSQFCGDSLPCVRDEEGEIVAAGCLLDDARLFAAAPELLEACQWALNYIDTLIHPEAPKVCDALKSAIAKARGDA